jgi:hypothetical protein
MGRKPTAHADTMYAQAAAAVQGMIMGEVRYIDMPSDLPFFRKYLSEIAKRNEQRFTTRSIDGQLQIMRVKYYNIHSERIEKWYIFIA